MNKQTHAYYDMAFKAHFLEKKGNAFQDLFCDIMDKCHPGDFQRMRPWGNQGDRKNDGYLRSRRTLFQVYAPDNMTTTKTIAKAKAKIREDFLGALSHWSSYFDTWIFVHNDMKGLPPDVFATIHDLEHNYSNLAIQVWGYPQLRLKVFTLSEADLADLFGSMPSSRDMLEVRFSDIEEVVAAIAAQPSPNAQDIRPVPATKLAYNQLSEDVEDSIRMGMRKSKLVGQFFGTYQDPEYGDKIAAAFRQQYMIYRSLQLSPDDIFHRLHLFAGGYVRQKPRQEAAVRAVLAYLFEQCEIFERPSEEVML